MGSLQLFRILRLQFFRKDGVPIIPTGQKLQKSYVGKAGTIAKKEFGIFQTMLFRENSEELEPQIRKNWNRPFVDFFFIKISQKT